VVVTPDAEDPEAPFDIAVQLLEPALSLSEAQGIDRLYTRPQGLDRIWVRTGFIPIPEADLPEALRGRPGLGHFGWRGGTAIWRRAGAGAGGRRGAGGAGGAGPAAGGGRAPAEPARRGERVPEAPRAPRPAGGRRRR